MKSVEWIWFEQMNVNARLFEFEFNQSSKDCKRSAVLLGLCEVIHYLRGMILGLGGLILDLRGLI